MRHIGAVALCIVIGGVLTVLSAWACAMWASPLRTSDRGVYLVGDQWSAMIPPGWPPPHHGIDRVGPGMTATEVNGYTGLYESHQGLIVQVGWPMRALAWGRFQPAAPPSGWREGLAAGLAVTAAPASVLNLQRTLPLWPLAAGFAVNTGVYACLAGVGLAGLGVRRRRKRRARGLCEACGYEVGMLAACPECGRSVRAPAAGTGGSGSSS